MRFRFGLPAGRTALCLLGQLLLGQLALGHASVAQAASIEFLDAAPIALSANGRHVLLGNVRSDRIEPVLRGYAHSAALFDLEDRQLVLVESSDPQETLQATALSANGRAVVGATNLYGSIAGGPTIGRWRADRGFERLEQPDEIGFRFPTALGTSRDGSIVIGSTVGLGAGSLRSFVWDEQGNVRPFMPTGGHPFDQALAISDSGDVFVGEARVETDGRLTRSATRWTETNGAERLIPETVRVSSSSATVLSGDGEVAFGTFRASPVEFERVFVHDAHGGFEDLGALLPEAFRARLVAASQDGRQAVGRAEFFGRDEGALEFPSEAILWDRERGARKVSELLVGLGVDLGGATLVEAIDISANGARILGRTSDGFTFIATIPEPRSPLLLLLGLAGLASVPRRRPGSS